MNARDRILGDIRGHLGRSAGQAPPAPPAVPLLDGVDLDATARLQRFEQRLQAVNGHCHRGAPAEILAELVAHYGARTIARSDAEPVAALAADPRFGELTWLPEDASKEQLFAADLGVTTAQWAVAETGTIALDHARERSRLASLLPTVHVALLPVSHVLATMGELLKTVGRPLPPALTFVTGPSRTADIELQLVLGVHGPRELHVVLV